MSNPFRQLPAVNDVLTALPDELRQPSLLPLATACIRKELENLRAILKEGKEASPAIELSSIVHRVMHAIEKERHPKIRKVLNGTGVILHTNLGRAPMAEEAATAASSAAMGYINLELDLETGKRSKRLEPVSTRLAYLLDCEAATVVNNNAAATVLALRALAMGKEVVVSRGQLVEIGGSFRIPEIMATSGAILREVGSTNITRISDYANAICPETRILLRVHSSNFRIVGHTEEATLEDMVHLARHTKRDEPLWVVDDIGSGAMADMEEWELADEPLARESLQIGADLVMFSGDKLFGGPQCGMLAGKKSLIQKIEADPLMRAFRLDKMQLAALEATLLLYQQGEEGRDKIPLFRMLNTPVSSLMDRAHLFVRYLGNIPGVTAMLRETEAFVGGGSLPDRTIPSVAIQLSCLQHTAQQLAYRLRTGHPAIMPRIENEEVMIDLRCIPSSEDQNLMHALASGVSG